MRLLVTGGAGFIGSEIVRQAIGLGHQVVNVDALTYAAEPSNLDSVASHPLYSFEEADIRDAAALRAVFERHAPEAVLHLAAESHVDRSIDGPGVFVETNVNGTFCLLQAALGHWRALDEAAQARFRFLHVSTDEVFGELGETGAFSEEVPYAPSSPYSASKAASDMLVRAWAKTFGLPVLITNCSNNYGPHQFPEKLIPVVVLNALAGRPIPVYGRGENIRDWLYVGDHAKAIFTVLEKGRLGETYCIGGDAERRNIDLVRAICGLMDELAPDSPHAPHADLITFVTDRPGHDHRYAIDASKLKRELGWRPSLALEEGLRETVSWYLENRDWWERIRARGGAKAASGDRIGLGAKPSGAA